MPEVIAVIVGFLLTAFAGNRILHSLQHRAWLRQQQFLGAEKEFIALRDLANDLSKAIGSRIYRMRRVLSACRSIDSDLEERLARYNESLVDWNENLASFTTRLTFYAGYTYTLRLENEIQKGFFESGADIESLIRLKRAGRPIRSAAVNRVDADLNRLTGLCSEFNRDIMRMSEDKRRSIYVGREIPYDCRHLDSLSTHDLWKLLFIRRVDGHTISRPPSDL